MLRAVAAQPAAQERVRRGCCSCGRRLGGAITPSWPASSAPSPLSKRAGASTFLQAFIQPLCPSTTPFGPSSEACLLGLPHSG